MTTSDKPVTIRPIPEPGQNGPAPSQWRRLLLSLKPPARHGVRLSFSYRAAA